jgi:TetR/AcrR family transcriptional regulator, cholesterol catabolism regulator
MAASIETGSPVPPYGSTPDRSEAARRLLASASDLFERQGAETTTVRQITESCGLTPAALYNHFESKEELLHVLLRDIHQRLELRMVTAQESAADDPTSQLSAVVGVYVDTHTSRRNRARLANRDFRLLTGERRDDIVAIRRRLRDRVAAILLTGQARGVFQLYGGPDRMTASMTATTILDMCITISEWYHEGRPLSAADMRDRYIGMALRLVGAVPVLAGPVTAADRPADPIRTAPSRSTGVGCPPASW